MKKVKILKRDRRHKKIRTKIFGTKERPRLSVFRSNKYVFAQIIDDENGKTLASASTKSSEGKTLIDKSKSAGKILAEEAKKSKISRVVFDRGGYLYKGRVKALAEGLREGGLEF